MAPADKVKMNHVRRLLQTLNMNGIQSAMMSQYQVLMFREGGSQDAQLDLHLLQMHTSRADSERVVYPGNLVINTMPNPSKRVSSPLGLIRQRWNTGVWITRGP